MAYFLAIFFLLLVGHYLADFPLQGDFLARAKNHMEPIPHVPWRHALFAHSVIHGGVVLLITGWWTLAIAEIIAHAMIDYRKSSGELTFAQDQYFHIGFKVIWAMVTAICA